jgi:hypothetical protein
VPVEHFSGFPMISLARLWSYGSVRGLSEGAVLLNRIFADAGVAGKYWLCGGAVLGLARSGGFLAHDRDLDFHYFAEDWPAFEALKKSGFRLRYTWFSNSGHPTEYVFVYNGVKFEFFEAQRMGDRFTWYSYCRRRFKRPARQFLNAVPADEFDQVTLFDCSWSCPRNKEQYLEALYGEEWRIPRKDYVYYMDSMAIIKREPWTGRRA